MPMKLMKWKYSCSCSGGGGCSLQVVLLQLLITLYICEEGREKTTRCRVYERDKLLASHAGLHLSKLKCCWHRHSSGNWRQKLKRIDNATATLQDSAAKHWHCPLSKWSPPGAVTDNAWEKVKLRWHGCSLKPQPSSIIIETQGLALNMIWITLVWSFPTGNWQCAC